MSNLANQRIVEDPRSLELHAIVSCYPSMSDEQLEALEQSIRTHGLQHPITLWRGRIIDGRHRWIAALNVNYPLTDEHFRVWEGEEVDLHDFVWSLNGDDCRRHLTKSVLATIGAQMKIGKQTVLEELKRQKCAEAGKEGGRGHKKGLVKSDETLSVAPARDARKEAAQQVGVSTAYISLAERVLEASPETFEEIKQGRKKLPKAVEELGVQKKPKLARDRDGGRPASPPELEQALVPAAPSTDGNSDESPWANDAVLEAIWERIETCVWSEFKAVSPCLRSTMATRMLVLAEQVMNAAGFEDPQAVEFMSDDEPEASEGRRKSRVPRCRPQDRVPLPPEPSPEPFVIRKAAPLTPDEVEYLENLPVRSKVNDPRLDEDAVLYREIMPMLKATHFNG